MLLQVLKGIKLLSQRVTSDDFCVSFWLKHKLYTSFTVSQDTKVYRLEELNKVKMDAEIKASATLKNYKKGNRG